MRLLYLSLSYVPSRRASSVQVMKTCGALAALGHDVTLVCKASQEPAAAGQSDHAFYGVPASFGVRKVARPGRRGGGAVYAAGVARALWQARGEVDLVYCRDVVGAALAAALGLPLAFELHGLPAGGWELATLRSVARAPSLRGLIAITDALRTDARHLGVDAPGKPFVVAHDAADEPAGPFVPRPLRAAGEPPRVGYVGNLYAGRGVELVVALARALPAVRFEIVGGQEADLVRFRASGLPTNLVLHGFVAPSQLGALYAGFDVVLLPHPRTGIVGATGGLDISRWTSPMKMFEYMASGAAIIASDLPVLGEVLRHDGNAVIAPAGDEAAWRQALEALLADPARRTRLAAQAHADLVAQHTWRARAEVILGGLGLR